MPDAVLLVSDLDAGRFPSRCVWSGEPTSSATHVWAVESRHADRFIALFGIVGVLALRALGRKTKRVPIPVTAGPYGVWSRRAMGYAGVTCFGLGLLIASAFRTSVVLAVFALLVVVASVLLRARAHSGFWVSAELRPAAEQVLIRRAHPAFDAEARALFLRKLQR